MFICNHCPFVKAIADRLAEDMKILQSKGIGVIAIMSNDTVSHPEDSFENMKKFAQNHGFHLPLRDRRNAARGEKLRRGLHPRFFRL